MLRRDSHLAQALSALGRRDEARLLLERARDDLLALGMPVDAVEAVVHLAACSVRENRAADALAILTDAERLADGNTAVFAAAVARVRAAAMVALGRLEDAADTASAGLADAERQGLPYKIGPLLVTRAKARSRAGISTARDDLARATLVLAPLGVPVDHA